MSGGFDTQLESTLRVALTKGLGPRFVARLRDRLGHDAAICAATSAELSEVTGIGARRAAEIRRALDDAPVDAELEAARADGVSLVPDGGAEYPPLLKTIPDPPLVLWVKGVLPGPAEPALAVVGSRKCTGYGREQATRLSALLAQSGLLIVSGGALGIDGAAHIGALRAGGTTLAVLGCGLRHCYPPDHAALFARIVDAGGALVSELPLGQPPRPASFPRRNRIISGMSLGVLVVEAGRGSGALITARLAAEEHGREVMVLPGRVDSPASAGCLQALREGWAAVVRDHADILEQIGSGGHLVRGALAAAGYDDPSSLTRVEPKLTADQRRILRALDENGAPMLVDHLAARTRVPMSQLLADITLLQIRGELRREREGVRRVR